MEKVRFFYSENYELLQMPDSYYGYKGAERPVVTTASVFDPKTNSLKFGAARYNPRDIKNPKYQFKKSIGRDIAFERALTDPLVEVFINPENEDMISHVSKAIAASIEEYYFGEAVEKR